MVESSTPSIELRSPVGYALMLQVTSAVLILGGTWYFGSPRPDLNARAFIAILVGVGFLQLLVARYIMQRKRSGILVAYALTTMSYFLAPMTAALWSIYSEQLAPIVLYLFVGGINAILTFLLIKISKPESS